MDQPTQCPRCGAEHSEPRGDGLCRRCVLEAAFRSAETPDDDLSSRADLEIVGDLIGPYRLLEKLGEGGMGVVHLAERTGAMRGHVALKLVKWGMDTKQVLARFEAERTALSLMDHPNIAKVLDGGATENGRPYFVMEYVKGESITRYCDRQRLDTRERLELFVDVCEGVQHAHQKGIIHRDLKPSNVLVQVHGDRVVPKIIDFGVAKATAHRLTERTLHTQLGQPLGTPEYMSPEQAEMTSLDIDTRTDVYSLGVLLYELLVGARPFELREGGDASYDEIRRRIREEEPAKPSAVLTTLDPDALAETARKRRTDAGSLRRRLRGDLDWIVLKALEKDRTRRYASATELAEEVRRHLRNLPVAAGPPSAAYQMRKFARRHRTAAATAAVVGLLVVGFGVTMAVQASRIASERDRANVEAESARQVSDFLVELFGLSDPSEVKGNSVTARELLDRGAARISRELEDQPLLQARLMDTMGRVYQRLGLFDDAHRLLHDTLLIRERLLDEAHPDVATSLVHLGHVYMDLGRVEVAETLLHRALAVYERSPESAGEDLGWCLYRLGDVYRRKKEPSVSRRYLERAMSVFERQLGPDTRAVAWCLNDLGVMDTEAGRLAEARARLQESLEIKRRLLGPYHEDVARSLGNLGRVHRELRQFEKATEIFEEVRDIFEEAYGPQHHTVATTLLNLGVVSHEAGDLERAHGYLSEARAIQESTPGRPENEVLSNLAAVELDMGRFDEAEAHLQQALTLLEDAFGPDSPWVAAVLDVQVSLLRKTGREAEAASFEERARRIRGQLEAAQPRAQ